MCIESSGEARGIRTVQNRRWGFTCTPLGAQLRHKYVVYSCTMNTTLCEVGSPQWQSCIHPCRGSIYKDEICIYMNILFFGFVMFYSYFFWIMTALLLSSYPVLHLVFYKDRSYKHLDFNCKMYVISKRIQFVVELALLPYIGMIGMNWGWHTDIRSAILVYAAPHAAALVMCSYPYVETLQHAVVLLLALLFQREDFAEDSAARCGVVYGCFSCVACGVHYALAERRMHRPVRFKWFLGTCACNWLWQFWYLLHHEMNLWGVVWVSCLVVLVNSDVLILKRCVEI